MASQRVLVVGTTPDYIAHIDTRYPGRALFLTDPVLRRSSREAAPDEASELLFDLMQADGVMAALIAHLSRYDLQLVGLACYDCEWLALTAQLAARLRLPYPGLQAIRLSRSKYLAKQRWLERDIPCPAVKLVASADDALAFARTVGDGTIVLKPLSGSGSELTFRCDDRTSILQSMRVIAKGLTQRGSLPMYQPDNDSTTFIDPRSAIVAEAFVAGTEYSADFILEDGKIEIIRIARKHRADDFPFGTTLAYELPAPDVELRSWPKLTDILCEAAESLGLNRAICMADFIISSDGPVVIELTPRIGGDCLPPLIEYSCGLDTIELALSFAEGKAVSVPSADQWQPLVGRRLFVTRGGRIRKIDITQATSDPRVKTVYLKRTPGHRVVLPPKDYDSWLLGHIIFAPASRPTLVRQADQLASLVSVDMETEDDQEHVSLHTASG